MKVTIAIDSLKGSVSSIEAECINPLRTITSTLHCKMARMVAEKKGTTVSKDKVFEVMEQINATVANLLGYEWWRNGKRCVW